MKYFFMFLALGMLVLVTFVIADDVDRAGIALILGNLFFIGYWLLDKMDDIADQLKERTK